MKKFCLKRVVESVIVLILISFFSFGVIELAPGDISSMYISPTMTEEEKQATIEKLGLDRSKACCRGILVFPFPTNVR